MSVKVLAGVRVVEHGTFITGPAASMLLADMGAEVVKVEQPAGDPFRAFRGGASRLARAARYNLNALGGFGLSLSVLGGLVHILSIHYMLANLVAIGTATLWNYISNVRWTWPALETVRLEARRGSRRG